jgi:transcription initiation factor TFIID subunit TAF12
MFKSQQHREKAAAYGELIKHSSGQGESDELQKQKDRHSALADNEQGLADDYDSAVNAAEQNRARGLALAAEEEHVFAMSRRGRHHAMERASEDAATRNLRHRRIGRKVIGDGGAPRADRPISAQAQERSRPQKCARGGCASRRKIRRCGVIAMGR